jgi:hypothetical protein
VASLRLAVEAPHPLGVLELAQRGDAEALPGVLVAAEEQAPVLQHALPEQYGGLVEEDDIDAAARSEVRQLAG